ncbi:hypothetical protein HYH02_015394 [Chlamydomonas schloesseri]|uniref:Uncharacterized protein n=1 Tax=Chlamydomonas schloesseri TaxID=2026947 RepID=A0A835SL40_9CHLO|nr:hypothetical protein HYH02_015448 [Chlamydomonas schloesseri]KAG2422750.1 hypothetical protein HYH02_015394 [Chlamydomonas schloesseri]|eukprot:KAG2422375.1 hypothetical protein HYH02_015448 [Chlamydomonas schloesseri]
MKVIDEEYQKARQQATGNLAYKMANNRRIALEKLLDRQLELLEEPVGGELAVGTAGGNQQGAGGTTGTDAAGTGGAGTAGPGNGTAPGAGAGGTGDQPQRQQPQPQQQPQQQQQQQEQQGQPLPMQPHQQQAPPPRRPDVDAFMAELIADAAREPLTAPSAADRRAFRRGAVEAAVDLTEEAPAAVRPRLAGSIGLSGGGLLAQELKQSADLEGLVGELPILGSLLKMYGTNRLANSQGAYEARAKTIIQNQMATARAANGAAAAAGTAATRNAQLLQANGALNAALGTALEMQDVRDMTRVVDYKSVVELQRNNQEEQMDLLRKISGFTPEMRAAIFGSASGSGSSSGGGGGSSGGGRGLAAGSGGGSGAGRGRGPLCYHCNEAHSFKLCPTLKNMPEGEEKVRKMAEYVQRAREAAAATRSKAD